MLKQKISHLKHKNHEKAKTLESFCKYQSNRFNQATFQQKFYQNHQKPAISLSETDLKIEQIKKKYGILPKNATTHTRHHSVHDRQTLTKESLGQSKKVLKERSLSNFTNHLPAQDLKQSQNLLSNNTIKSPRKQFKAQSIKDKENIVSIDSRKVCIKQEPSHLFKLDYNDTFNKQALRTSTLHQEKLQLLSKADHQKVNKKAQQSQVISTRRSGKNNYSQKDFWSSTYIPRLQNIDKIKVKIKSALQNFQNFEKRDISIPLSKKKVQKMSHYHPVLAKSIKKSARQNDLIETRVVQKIPFHHRTTSYLTTSFDHVPFATIKTEGNQLQKSKRVSQLKLHTQVDFESRFEILKKEKNNHSNNEDKLFSRIKNLYKRSEQLQEKKVEIMNVHQRHLSYDKVLQKTNRQMHEMRSSSLAFSKIDKLQEIKNKYINKTSYRSIYTQNQGEDKTDKRITTVRKIKSPQKLSFNLINVKEDKSESYGDEIQEFDKNQDEINQGNASPLKQFIKLAKSGIETRKKAKKAGQNSGLTKKLTENKNKDFCSMIKQQIQLDQHFRKAKYWFRYQAKEKKWQQLNRELLKTIQNLKFDISQKNMKEDNELTLKFLINKTVQSHFINFEMLDEQIDPFFSIRVFQFTYADLVEAYIEAEKHWIKICKTGMISKLIKTKLIEEIDNDKKGYGNLTGLTRFINLKSQSFYKNRDLALFFKRLTSIQPSNGSQMMKNIKSNEAANMGNHLKQSLQMSIMNNRITCDSLHRLNAQSMK